VRGDAGATLIADQDFSQLPSSLRFFAGGDSSVRGYNLDVIGPQNDQDDVIGGRYLLVGSVEYERRILPAWSLATFVDVGDAFDDSPELKTGVGIGVRWQSPVGPVRVDVASGLEDPGDSVRLHVSIGPDL
jgi:translocation and assembly module TamA